MAKSKKMSDFRTLNLSTETTPINQNVGAVSAVKKSTNPKKISAKSSKEEQPSRRINLGLTIFFLILVILGVFVGCLFTPPFEVSNINVQNGIYVQADEILSKMDGVRGTNIFRINTKSLVKLIKENPYIKEVKIERQYPNGLYVHFEERTPYALIKYLESYIVVDKYGYVLEIKKENDMMNLAIIYGINADEYVPGNQITDLAGLKYKNLTYMLEISNMDDFDYTICEMNYTDTERLIMSVKELDVDINFGEIERNILNEKMSYLNGILKKLTGKKGNLDISSNSYLEKTIFTERY